MAQPWPRQTPRGAAVFVAVAAPPASVPWGLLGASTGRGTGRGARVRTVRISRNMHGARGGGFLLWSPIWRALLGRSPRRPDATRSCVRHGNSLGSRTPFGRGGDPGHNDRVVESHVSRRCSVRLVVLLSCCPGVLVFWCSVLLLCSRAPTRRATQQHPCAFGRPFWWPLSTTMTTSSASSSTHRPVEQTPAVTAPYSPREQPFCVQELRERRACCAPPHPTAVGCACVCVCVCVCARVCG